MVNSGAPAHGRRFELVIGVAGGAGAMIRAPIKSWTFDSWTRASGPTPPGPFSGGSSRGSAQSFGSGRTDLEAADLGSEPTFVF